MRGAVEQTTRTLQAGGLVRSETELCRMVVAAVTAEASFFEAAG